MSEYSVILFFSNNYSIMASNVLKKNDIDHKMVPVPRHLSSDCGYCVRIKSIDIESAQRILKERSVEYERIESL